MLDRESPKYLKHFTYIPVSKAIVPEDGDTVMADRYWAVVKHNNEDCIMFYHDSPQCNHGVELSDHVYKGLYPDCEIRHIPFVFKYIDYRLYE